MTPALERTVLHRETPVGFTRVCRNLFGPVDHDRLSRELKASLKDMAEQDARRWNFNFQTDEPLPGRYEWEETPLRTAPVFYREAAARDEAMNTEDTASCHREVKMDLEDRDISRTNLENRDISNTHTVPNEATPGPRKRTFSERVASHTSNAQITDFFVKRRRTSETKTSLNSFFTSSSEQTLRKRIR